MTATDKKINLRLNVKEVKRLESQKLEVLGADLNDTLNRVHLEGVWAQNQIIRHSIIHVINPTTTSHNDTTIYIVNNTTGFLVVEPDNLLTCTLVASSLFCERKTWLNTLFSGLVGTNRPMLVGTLVHEVFQYGLKNKIADIDKLTQFLDVQLDDATVMLEIYSVECHLKEIRDEVIRYISSVKEWIERYLLSGPLHPLTNDSQLQIKVTEVSDIEENVWSTKYGLKGKIDVTGMVRIYDKQTKTFVNKKIPLELKTGNPNLSSSHAAQVSLYSMMIEDRYAETNQGFVIYLKNQAAMHNVPLTHNIKRDLIQRRNHINFYMKSFTQGPDMVDQMRMCKNCDRLTECILVSHMYSPGEIDKFPTMKSLEQEAIGHLDEKFKTFFQKYHEKLLNLMANSDSHDKGTMGDTQRKVANSFWTYSSQEAEVEGTGFGGLQVVSVDELPNAAGSIVVFKRHPIYDSQNNTSSASSQQQPIVIDLEEEEHAVKKVKISDFFRPVKKSEQVEKCAEKESSKPFDTTLSSTRGRWAISLDKSLKQMNDQNSYTAIAIGFLNEITRDKFTMKLLEGSIDSCKDLVYRVDRLEKKSTLVEIERIVLVRLLLREDWRCERVRQLILDSDYVPQNNKKLNYIVMTRFYDEISSLEPSLHETAVEAISTDNYYVITEEDEPKKSEMVNFVLVLSQIIFNLDKTLLIVAQNIDDLVNLMKLLQNRRLKFNLIDDGKSAKARYQFPDNLVKVPQQIDVDINRKFEAYIRQLESVPIVISTFAMSIGGLQFTRRKFDYCIAYDCDITELLTSLSPMFISDRHIIIDIKDTNINTPDNISLGDHLRELRK